jgi:predicted PurR-regulated permease PerM
MINFLSLLLITPVVVFYLLVDWHPMLDKLDGWLPRDHVATIRRLADEINAAVSAFIRGQGTICLVLAGLYAAALSWAGVRYGLLIGLVSGLGSFIPFVGWALGLITAGAMAVTQPWPNVTLLLTVAGIYFAGMALDSAVLAPKIVGRKIGLHPVWMIFALFVFSYLFGFVGLLVAVPVAAATGVLVRFALELYLGSSVYTGVTRSGEKVHCGGPQT